MPIHRTMHADADGLPWLARTAEGLGVRLEPPVIEIEVIDGFVGPGDGGMSVYGDPEQMHPNRRPSFLPGGKSLLPLFGLNEADIPDGLRLTEPRKKDTHMV
jgi:hypothetical protein